MVSNWTGAPQGILFYKLCRDYEHTKESGFASSSSFLGEALEQESSKATTLSTIGLSNV